MSLDAQKAAARKAALARRREAAAAGDGGAGAARLAEVLRPHAGRPLSGYMPMRGEIDPLPAMAAHRGPVGVPVIEGRGLPLRFREWRPDAEMVEGPFGALVPAAGGWIEPEVLIVPLVAFDRRGYRLGYGGGFYDRTLARLRSRHPVVAIGFAWAAQEDPDLPVGPQDERLDLIVTEAGVIRPG
ncbi:MAG: 5-formyltetrahydrofolate cyclo-ligase [Rhodobacteraceae bacterium]|nr:5-formyltetrahydrofolate cyclo-ligase [Paracoccaceae bacterium]